MPRVFVLPFATFLTLLVFGLGHASFAQIFRPSGATTSDQTYPLEGTVVDSVTGDPIRHALVQVYLGTQHATFTDGEGHFRFARLPQTQTSVRVTKPGYLDEGGFVNRYRQTLVSIGPKSPPLTLKLVPQAKIHGTVTGANGQTLDNVPVRLSYLTVQNGKRQRQEYRQAQTDDDGIFQFSDLPPGDYVIAAGPSW